MIGALVKHDIVDMIDRGQLRELREILSEWTAPEIASLVNELDDQRDVKLFGLLPHGLATETFAFLDFETQYRLLQALGNNTQMLSEILNDLAPDDRTALLEGLPGEIAQRLLTMLTPEERRIASQLLGYPAESIGRQMTPDYVAIRSAWTVQRSLDHIRKYGKDSETLNVIYVVDDHWRLLDDLRIRELLLADPDTVIESIMDSRYVALRVTDDQETAVQTFRDNDRVALPVIDGSGVLVGIVTIDDVLEIAEDEATEDIQKLGAVEALDDPYIHTPVPTLIRKRAKWLIVLFLGELLTASAMGYFESELAHAVVLALFVPLIISSGGNSGAQASTLLIRALAVGEITLADWRRVLSRELLSGLMLGTILGVLGLVRVGVWQAAFGTYGEHWLRLGMTVGIALLGVVLWGTVTGSMLPFVLRRAGADPAVSSGPFVATLVDVTGLIIYFSVAAALLGGYLL